MRRILFLFFSALACIACSHLPSNTDAVHSPNETRATAAVIGWEGDQDAAIVHDDGSFDVRDGNDITVQFGIYQRLAPTALTWDNEDGYLPSLITRFAKSGIQISITEFADLVVIGKNRYVVVYARVQAVNETDAPFHFAPEASPQLIPLSETSVDLPPRSTAHVDYAIAVDRFSHSYRWPSSLALRRAGTWDTHHAHMKDHWNRRLAEIAGVQTPDPSLNNAYKAGFIYTEIVKDGTDLKVGENGYNRVYDHDASEILASLLAIGDASEAPALLDSLPFSFQYHDATWKYPWPWALYLLKTGDASFVKAHWGKIRSAAHQIHKDRSGPQGIMVRTEDLDAGGYWTADNWAALTGLLAYEFIAKRLDKKAEIQWAHNEYSSLLRAVNQTLAKTMATYKLPYLPVSMLTPNTETAAKVPDSAIWVSHLRFGHWLWDGYLLGADPSGPTDNLAASIDATYEYGFARLHDAGRPPHTFGAYPGYSTGSNAGYAISALRGNRYRSEGILAYQFLIKNAQSGPFSWWERIQEPGPTPWVGIHPRGGSGSCPNIWGQAVNTKALIDSLLVEFYDGRLLVGRGIPTEWLAQGVRVDHFPIAGHRRVSMQIQAKDHHVSLQLTGDLPLNEIDWELPLFTEKKILNTSVGRVEAGRVLIPAQTPIVDVVYQD